MSSSQFNVSGVPNFTIPFYVDEPYTSTLELPYPCPGFHNSEVLLFAYHVPSQATVALDVSADGELGSAVVIVA